MRGFVSAPWTVAVLLAGLTLGGCASRAEFPEPGAGEATTILEVDNRSTMDMVIYALTPAGARTRLGTATSLRRSRLTIPSRLVPGITTLRIQADPVGSTRAPISDRISVTPGDIVVVQIPPM